MAEPVKLTAARQHLSLAEANYRSKDGLLHLEEGLALLEEVALDDATGHKAIAYNLLSAYSTRICESVRNVVATERGLPGPDLEHLFKVLLAFDAAASKLPGYVRELKIDVVRRLIDLYYEGYPAGEKEQVLQQLTGIVGGGND
jgi:hypothetical protein